MTPSVFVTVYLVNLQLWGQGAGCGIQFCTEKYKEENWDWWEQTVRRVLGSAYTKACGVPW